MNQRPSTGDPGRTQRDFELVIFDCDGVLVDTEVISIRVDQRVLAHLGWDLGLEEIVHRFVGKSEANFVAQIERQLRIELAEDWDAEYVRWYHDAYERELTVVDGIVEALDGLLLPSCVASSGSHSKMEATLGMTGLYPRFAGRIFSATEVRNGKPAPDLFLHSARSLGFDPAACAVVEDSVHGVNAARAAGMHAFAYGSGVTPAEHLAGPDTTVFLDMRDLPGLIAAGRPS